MESNDLGSKKMNNKQNPNEDSSGEKLIEDTNPAASKLKAEVETDTEGNQKIVQRARNVDAIPEQNNESNNENPSSSIEIVSEKQTQRMIENEDHNSDVTAHRYPNSHPDNKEDRGNMKLDE